MRIWKYATTGLLTILRYRPRYLKLNILCDTRPSIAFKLWPFDGYVYRFLR